MGLDMYLRGQKYYWSSWDRPKQDRMEDGYKVTQVVVELGYWRKHADLHGFIVRSFAAGVDECQEIELTAENLDVLIKACATPVESLGRTTGFFFGESSNDAEQIAQDVRVFKRAQAWMMRSDEEGMVSKRIATSADGGMEAHAVIATDPVVGRQRVTRDVIYRASW